jgi:hypothetical protein
MTWYLDNAINIYVLFYGVLITLAANKHRFFAGGVNVVQAIMGRKI